MQASIDRLIFEPDADEADESPRDALEDEATRPRGTSSVDKSSVTTVDGNLNKKMSTVIIAHRLSTIQNADIIYVVHEGKVIEKGSHNQLLQIRNGIYQKLVRVQQGNASR